MTQIGRKVRAFNRTLIKADNILEHFVMEAKVNVAEEMADWLDEPALLVLSNKRQIHLFPITRSP